MSRYGSEFKAVFLLAVCCLSRSSMSQSWPVDTATIQKFETNLRASKYWSRYSDVRKFDRYYAPITQNGRRIIAAEFLLLDLNNGKTPDAHIVSSEKDLPVIFDGGCSVINAVYDVEADRILSFACNGQA